MLMWHLVSRCLHLRAMSRTGETKKNLLVFLFARYVDIGSSGERRNIFTFVDPHKRICASGCPLVPHRQQREYVMDDHIHVRKAIVTESHHGSHLIHSSGMGAVIEAWKASNSSLSMGSITHLNVRSLKLLTFLSFHLGLVLRFPIHWT
jgi:hypothetical protein